VLRHHTSCELRQQQLHCPLAQLFYGLPDRGKGRVAEPRVIVVIEPDHCDVLGHPKPPTSEFDQRASSHLIVCCHHNIHLVGWHLPVVEELTDRLLAAGFDEVAGQDQLLAQRQTMLQKRLAEHPLALLRVRVARGSPDERQAAMAVVFDQMA
jgi:hypothetical protein